MSRVDGARARGRDLQLGGIQIGALFVISAGLPIAAYTALAALLTGDPADIGPILRITFPWLLAGTADETALT